MPVLYFFESIRNPVCDALVSLITLFGDEVLFMAVAMVFFWCVDKREGYYLLCIGFFGTVLNQFLKMFFRIPRPWVKDPSFSIVESAREAATGYSFPSGHTQTSIGLYGGIARWNRNRILRIFSVLMCVLVPFSRLYLGVHTPLDVGVSVLIGLVLVLGGYPLFRRAQENPRLMYAILGVLTLAMIGQLFFLFGYPFPAEVYEPANIENLISAKENAFTLLGCNLGMLVVYAVDSRFTRFETEAVFWAQLLKVGIGLVLVLAAKEGLKPLFDLIFVGELPALAGRAMRYFCMVMVAGVLWPMTFRWFKRLGEKTEEK